MGGEPVRNLPSLFETAAREWPDRVALIEDRDESSAAQWTFAELYSASRSAGGSLLESGLKTTDRVALIGNTTAGFLIADAGIAAAGLVRVPLDPSLTYDEHVSQISDAGVRAIVYEPAFVERAEALGKSLRLTHLFSTEGLQGIGLIEVNYGSCPSPGSIDPGSIASLNYTGGSTGSPKAVMLTHSAFATVVRNIIQGHPIGPDDIFLNVRPLWPIAAVMVMAHLAGGARVVLGGRFNTKKFLALCQSYAITTSSLVPTMLVRLLATVDPGQYDLRALRAIDVGGSGIPPEVFQQAIAAFGPKVGVIYGLTEASYTCYLRPESLHPDQCPAYQLADRIQSVGKALGANEVVIRGPDGQPLLNGEIGEITIAGDHLMLGYWNRQDLTGKALRNGYLYTGDLGKLDKDGRLTVTGRLKEIIRSGTKTVIPAEVEQALRSHPDVEDCAVMGLPDREWGEIVAAAIVRRAGSAITSEQLIDHCKEHLSAFKKPRLIVFFEHLPRSHYGKVMRGKIVAALQELVATRVVPPGGSFDYSTRQSKNRDQ